MERGRIYGQLTGGYGETVKVYGSSSAEAPHCWVSIDTAKNKNDYMAGERVEATAHLSIEEAKVLRAGLDSFIAQATDASEEH